MKAIEDNYTYLLQNLDAFIRKYYKNMLIRGGIWCSALFIALYLCIIILEYYSRFNTQTRTILFFSYIIINVVVISRLIVIPLTKIFRLGKIISHEQAAHIIGKHFAEVKDKLSNTLQLKVIADDPFYAQSRELIHASIVQKTAELRPVPFVKAVDFRKNRKYVKFALIPLSVFVILLFSAPSVIKSPTERLLNYNKEFPVPPPFSFNILNDSLSTIRQKDYTLQVKVEGNLIPDNVYLVTGNSKYRLRQKTNVLFEHTFRNPQEDINFRLSSQDVNSSLHTLKVLPSPSVLNFSVQLSYPAYLKRQPETLNNTGDLVVPEGTLLSWTFSTRDADNLTMTINDDVITPEKSAANSFKFSQRAKQSSLYSLKTENRYVSAGDSMVYSLNVIPDAYPEIAVEEFSDSLFSKRLFFSGYIRDDYGFSKLAFRFTKNNDDTQKEDLKTTELIISPQLIEQSFNYFWDLTEMNLQPGDEISYYFEVWDNDGINGAKSAKSRTRVFKLPSYSDFDKQMAEKSREIENTIDQSLQMAKDLQDKIEDFNLKMLEKSNPGWEEKQKMEEILKMQRELERRIDEFRQENMMKDQMEKEYYQYSESLMEKQKKLQELFEKIATDEMKKLMEEMQKLLEQFDKNKAQDLMEKMKLSNQDLEKELDRTMELYKQIEFEQKLEEAISKLNELEEKQNKLSEETAESKRGDKEELLEKQEKLNEEFQDIRKDIEDLKKKNAELQQPNKMENTGPLENQIQQEQKNSSDKISGGQNKKASEAQKNASGKMKELGEKMQDMYDQMQQESIAEDLHTLREILENILKTSFDQENLMLKLQKTSPDDPGLASITIEQRRLKDNTRLIQDSLFALSKRQVQIESFVNKEMNLINSNMDRAIDFIANRTDPDKRRNFVPQAAARKQLAMTSLNNLALLLSEVAENMQSQMMQQAGQGSCSKPGNNNKPGQGKMSVATMRKMQQELNKQMEELNKALQDGKTPGAGQDRNTMSEQFARMAAQQEALRNQLQKISQELKNDPNAKSGNLDKIASEMEKIENDLVHKRITEETLKRQKDILTRLLQAEKSERERETEEKRESKEAKSDFFGNPFENLQYKRMNRAEEEILRTIPPDLKIFYRTKVNEYFHNIDD